MQRLTRGAWQVVLLLGVASVLLGIAVLAWPKATLAVIGALFGAYLVVSGILQLIAAFGTHSSAPMRVLGFISGAITILLGLFCFRGALESILLLALWIGIAWLFRGIAQTAAAASDPLTPARGWQIAAGVIGALAGIVLLVSPLDSIAVLAVLGGCWLLVMGLVEIVTALQLRRHASELPPGV